MPYLDILLPLPLDGTFTYRAPEPVGVGCRVVVTFGRTKKYVGLVCASHDAAPKGVKVKDIEEVIDHQPVVLPSQLALWTWMADYYLCALGDVMKAALPAGLKEPPRQHRHTADTEKTADPIAVRPLSEAQQRALDEIHAAFTAKDVCLLHGVTSSGKTEVYTHLMEETLQRGRQVLFLLPEIVLTAQLVERLQRVFGPRLGVYHSRYADTVRERLWQKQLSQEPYDIIVGVRSSIFLPFQRLGLVIVDEEHETSYKQEDPAPRYHARNVALVLARQAGAKTLLGTATPALETYRNAETGKYALVHLTERYRQIALPEIVVVDMNDQRRRKRLLGIFSEPLLTAMRDALAGGEQIILFQNRRGFSPVMMCRTCGWTPRCQKCDVSLTLHKTLLQLTCHYCGQTYQIPPQCPQCGETDMRGVGYGTERIETQLHDLLPEARVARMDLDTTRSRTAYEQILHDFAEGRTNVLVGTQMVTKGLDFERVSVVGILGADTMLNAPDFRAYERAFQMMSQVAGRAGRHGHRGKVFLQTRSADLPVVRQTVQGDYLSLYADQCEERAAFLYPPFAHLVYVYLKHRDATTIDHLATDLVALLRRVFGPRILGPDTPPVGRIKMLYIRKIVIKLEAGASLAEMRRRLREIQSYILAQAAYKSAQMYYDVDPY